MSYLIPLLRFQGCWKLNRHKDRNKATYSAENIALNETASGCAGQNRVGNLFEYIEAFETCDSWTVISQ
jgi:hypothetical protein